MSTATAIDEPPDLESAEAPVRHAAEQRFLEQNVQNTSFHRDAVRTLLHGCVMHDLELPEEMAATLGIDRRQWVERDMQEALLSLADDVRRDILIAIIRANAAFQRIDEASKSPIALGDALRLVSSKRKDGLDVLGPELGMHLFTDHHAAEQLIRAQSPEIRFRTLRRIEMLMNGAHRRIDLYLRDSDLQ